MNAKLKWAMERESFSLEISSFTRVILLIFHSCFASFVLYMLLTDVNMWMFMGNGTVSCFSYLLRLFINYLSLTYYKMKCVTGG